MSKPVYFYHPLSPPCRSPLMVAKEIGLDLELREVDLVNKEHLSESFKKINPAGTIPSLIDGDVIICDSHAIDLYLIEKYAKDDSLYPKNDLILRTTINDRLFFDASFLFPRGCNIMGPVLLKGELNVEQEKYDALHRCYQALEEYLTKTKFLAADKMTLADLCVFAWIEAYGQVVSAEEGYPKISAWLNILRKLPYYKEANKTGADLQVKLFREAMAKAN